MNRFSGWFERESGYSLHRLPEKGGVTQYNGNYTYYIEKRRPEQPAPCEERRVGAGGEAYRAKKERSAQLRRLRSRITAAEQELETVDRELAEVNEALSGEQGSDYPKALELTERFETLTAEQTRLLEEWETACEALEALEAQP